MFAWKRAYFTLGLRTLRDPTVVRLLLDIMQRRDLKLHGYIRECNLYAFVAMPEYVDAKRRFGF